MRALLNIPILCFIFLTGCASGPEFEASIMPEERKESELPAAWRQSIDPEPYFPPDIPATSNPEGDAEGSSPVDESSIMGGAGRGASVLKIDQPPYGTPVPGKSQLVKSPFSNQGFVDVSGHPPETEVKCPYTGKVFLVP